MVRTKDLVPFYIIVASTKRKALPHQIQTGLAKIEDWLNVAPVSALGCGPITVRFLMQYIVPNGLKALSHRSETDSA